MPEYGIVQQKKYSASERAPTEFDILRLCCLYESFASKQHGRDLSAGQSDDNTMYSSHTNCRLQENLFYQSEIKTGKLENL